MSDHITEIISKEKPQKYTQKELDDILLDITDIDIDYTRKYDSLEDVCNRYPLLTCSDIDNMISIIKESIMNELAIRIIRSIFSYCYSQDKYSMMKCLYKLGSSTWKTKMDTYWDKKQLSIASIDMLFMELYTRIIYNPNLHIETVNLIFAWSIELNFTDKFSVTINEWRAYYDIEAEVNIYPYSMLLCKTPVTLPEDDVCMFDPDPTAKIIASEPNANNLVIENNGFNTNDINQSVSIPEDSIRCVQSKPKSLKRKLKTEESNELCNCDENNKEYNLMHDVIDHQGRTDRSRILNRWAVSSFTDNLIDEYCLRPTTIVPQVT